MIPSDRVSNRSSVAVLSFPLFLLAISNLPPPVVSFCLPFFRSWTVQVQSELTVHRDRQRRKRCQSAGDRREPELGNNVHHRTAPLWSPLPLAFIYFFLKQTTFGWCFTTYICSRCYRASPVSAWRFTFYLITLNPNQLNNICLVSH